MDYKMNTATAAQILELMASVQFPEVRGTTPMDAAYAEKLHRHATRVEVWDADLLAGIICMYVNNLETKVAHGTLFCVRPAYTGHGSTLLRKMIAYCKSVGFKSMHVGDIDEDNKRTVGLYRRLGGKVIAKEGRCLTFELVFPG